MPAQKPKHSTRSLAIRGALIGLVLVSAWIVVLVGAQMLSGSTRMSYRAHITAILSALRDGRALEVYEDASPLFKDTMVRDRFIEMTERLNNTLGSFIDIETSKTIESTSGPRGKTGLAQARLVFANATTTSEFSFHQIGDEWRLLGFRVDIPPQFAANARQQHREHRAAPKEVFDLVTTTLTRLRDGEAAAVYEETSDLFKGSVPRDKFLAHVATQNKELGAFKRTLYVIRAGQSTSQSRAKVIATLEFERAKTTGTMEFLKVTPKGASKWKLLSLWIGIPSPRLPGAGFDP